MNALKSLTLALCFSAQSASVCAQNASPVLTAQERLDAIRHSLVETALQGATQVKTTLWLDAQGQLHDSSSFRSGMEVRGVRVMSYSRDSAGKPKHNSMLQPLPKTWVACWLTNRPRTARVHKAPPAVCGM